MLRVQGIHTISALAQRGLAEHLVTGDNWCALWYQGRGCLHQRPGFMFSRSRLDDVHVSIGDVRVDHHAITLPHALGAATVVGGGIFYLLGENTVWMERSMMAHKCIMCLMSASACRRTARAVASQLAIINVCAECLPANKASKIRVRDQQRHAYPSGVRKFSVTLSD